MAAKLAPRPLTVQDAPVYKLSAPPALTRFIFAPDTIDDEQGLRLIETQGAWQTNGFQSLLDVPEESVVMQPVVAPRPGHMALVLAAGYRQRCAHRHDGLWARRAARQDRPHRAGRPRGGRGRSH